MKNLFIILACLALMVVAGCAKSESDKSPADTSKADTPKQEAKVTSTDVKHPRVIMETDMGKIVLELFPEVAPNHVKNFLELANKGFYNGLTFHRIIKNFVIQGGDPKGDGTGDAGYSVAAEFSNLQHMPGTLAMARANDPNSASCQFYICLSQLPSLDGKYTIFGQVAEGMDVVNKIGGVPTGAGDRPTTPVKMVKVYQEGKEPAAGK
jgi:peptidyl-prolyl cis-trans isomerase B (cyclophilin B)